MREYKYLKDINSPDDLKKIPDSSIEALNEEIRDFLIENVSRNGGHLASNLGVVEISVALHRVFETPRDHIIWDVGHQSYVHKILTGRKDKFHTIRRPGGISGFTKIEESEHDCFGAGHSSTSISAALGFAEADKLKGSDAYTIAIVGDGAFTGGMIHEGLNNCKKDLNLIIVINENEMSISKNIGQFAKNLSKLRMRSGYLKAKRFTGNAIKKIPFVGKYMFKIMLKVKKAFKNIVYGSNYFEDLGLYYLGPIDGNDYESVENIFREAKKLNQSVVIHLKTLKGKGYDPAEENPNKYHGISPADVENNTHSLTDAFGKILCEMAEKDSQICAITAAMADGTGLCDFRKNYKDRFFDVGIAEEHAVTFGAGLAANGMKPVVAIYSTFLQRAYDNIIHDVALQKLPVTFCIDRAGLNEKDGATHHGIFDVSFLSQIPNMKIYTPVTEEALRRSMHASIYGNSPTAIRYSNGGENKRVLREFYADEVLENISLVKNYKSDNKSDLLIITYGRIVNEALIACDELKKDGIIASIILLERLKPYDTLAQEILNVLPKDLKGIVYLEEEIKNGGMGMLLSEQMEAFDIIKNIPNCIMAIDDNFVTVRNPNESIYESACISAKHIIDNAKALLN